LLQDDGEWDQCLSETTSVQLPKSLNQLFASLLIYNNVTNPGRLWDRHKGALTEDFLHQAHQVSGQKASTKECILQTSLLLGCDGISYALLSSLNYWLETSLLNG
jgi:hypothetical protein